MDRFGPAGRPPNDRICTELSLTPYSVAILLGLACAVGALCAFLGWSARGRRATTERDAVVDEWQTRLTRETREKLALNKNNKTLKAALDHERGQLETLKGDVAARTAESRSLQEDLHAASEQLGAVTRERDNLAQRIANVQGAVATANQRTRDLEAEFAKSREFYKGQLMTAAEQRQSKDKTLNAVLEEKQALLAQTESARTEIVALQSQLATTKTRLDSQDALEQKVIALEADNAELKHELMTTRQSLEEAQGEVLQLTELQAQNERSPADESKAGIEPIAADPVSEPTPDSEDVSETLRVRLSDFQKRLAEMQQDHLETGVTGHGAEARLPPFGIEKPAGQTDDLTKIVGVGKVFEAMLHRLGVYYYQQIATFGPAEVARINSELNEFKGRIEHDNWIGQARQLHAEKYSGTAAQTGHR